MLSDDIKPGGGLLLFQKKKKKKKDDFSICFYLPLLIMIPFVAVAVTQILWRPRGLLVDTFDSKEDVINAVFTSSFIPG